MDKHTQNTSITDTQKLKSLVLKMVGFYLYQLCMFVKYVCSLVGRKLKHTFGSSFSNKIIYFDFETTGLNIYHDRIIEYAFVEEDRSDSVETPSHILGSLVNPGIKFEKKITEITGIHPDQLEDKEPIEKHKDNIMSFITSDHRQYTTDDKYFVGHNCVSFDQFFLKRIFPKEHRWKFVDTLLLAKKLMPEHAGFSQSNLAKHFNIENGGHRATSDTICVRKLYHKLLEILASKTTKSVDYYLKNPENVLDYIES